MDRFPVLVGVNIPAQTKYLEVVQTIWQKSTNVLEKNLHHFREEVALRMINKLTGEMLYGRIFQKFTLPYEIVFEIFKFVFRNRIPIDISADGRWTHPRNAKEHTFSVLCAYTKLILALQHVTKSRKKMVGDLNSCSSKSMEGEAADGMIRELLQTTVLDGEFQFRVKHVIKDGDSSM